MNVNADDRELNSSCWFKVTSVSKIFGSVKNATSEYISEPGSPARCAVVAPTTLSHLFSSSSLEQNLMTEPLISLI